MALERNAVLLQEAGYTTATGRPEQSSDLAHGAGSIHDSSNSTPSAKHIWTPPVSRGELQTRFGTRLQSYIRPACRASDEALALMDLRALRSADQSGGLSRPCVATEFGSAGPTGSPSASHKTPYATSARAGFSAPISLWPHAVLRPALSQPGVGEPGRKTARVSTLLGR